MGLFVRTIGLKRAEAGTVQPVVGMRAIAVEAARVPWGLPIRVPPIRIDGSKNSTLREILTPDRRRQLKV